jgi:hypothetical protein
MNSHRFTQIIDAYGSRPERWPDTERTAVLQYISSHAVAQQYLDSQTKLDAQLDAGLAAPLLLQQTELEARIMANLPPILALRHTDNFADRLLAWLLPKHSKHEFWRPSLVACVPFLAGLAIGSNISLESYDDSYTWDEQVYLLGLPASTETEASSWLEPLIERKETP